MYTHGSFLCSHAVREASVHRTSVAAQLMKQIYCIDHHFEWHDHPWTNSLWSAFWDSTRIRDGWWPPIINSLCFKMCCYRESCRCIMISRSAEYHWDDSLHTQSTQEDGLLHIGVHLRQHLGCQETEWRRNAVRTCTMASQERMGEAG